MPLRLRSAGGGSVQLNSPVALATDVSMEVPAYDGAKVLTNKTPGCVLQVLHANITASQTTTSTSWSDLPGLSVTITPNNATSKFLVTGNLNGDHAADTGTWFRLVRDATALTLQWVYIGQPTNATYGGQTTTINFVDSPATTSPVTYKLQWRTDVGGVGSYLNRSDSGGQSGFTSGITVVEIAA